MIVVAFKNTFLISDRWTDIGDYRVASIAENRDLIDKLVLGYGIFSFLGIQYLTETSIILELFQLQKQLYIANVCLFVHLS